jgi:spore germination protein KB
MDYRQFAILVLLFTIGTSIIIAPSMLAAYAKQDGWISALIGLLVGLFVVWCYASIGTYFKDKTLIAVINESFGKYLGFVVALVFSVFALILSSLVLSNIGNFVNTRLLLGTPLDSVEYTFVITVVIGVRLGIETICRSTEFLIPLFAFLFLILTFAVLPQMDVENLLPVFEHDVHDIFKSSYGFISFPFVELMLFLMLTPYVAKQKNIKKGYLIGATVGGVLLVIITVVSIMSLGGGGTAINTYPAFSIAKKIDVGGVVQRMEVIMAWIWMFSIFSKLSVCLYVSTVCFQQLFRLRDVNCLTLPIALSLIPLSQWLSPSAVDFQTYTTRWMMYFTYITMCIPLLTAGIFFLKRKWTKN